MACNPTKPKFNGNFVTATTQIEKTIHITESHVNKILFESPIVTQKATWMILVQKSYELKILTQNID